MCPAMTDLLKRMAESRDMENTFALPVTDVETFDLRHDESKRYQSECFGTRRLNHGTWQAHDKCLASCRNSTEKCGRCGDRDRVEPQVTNV